MPITSGGKVVLIDPGSRRVVLADPEVAAQQIAAGYQPATPDDVAQHNRLTEYGSVAQQSLAQAERVVRGATLGQVEGIGSDEDIRARAEVSEELNPAISMAADFAPDVALGIATGGVSALATSGGRIAAKQALKAGVRGALGAAAKKAPLAALAGESIAGGLVTASQQAFQEGRQFFREDPVTDATNTLLWSGIGGILGGAPMAFKAARGGLGKAGKEAAELADEADLKAAFKAGEDSVPVGTVAPETVADEAAIPRAVGDGLEPVKDTRAPLTDIRMPDAEGMLDSVDPTDPRLASATRELDALRTEGIAGLSLSDLRAIPIDEGFGAAESAAKVDAFAKDESFLKEGMLRGNNDRSRGGLPAIGIDADGYYLSNGRHRIEAARKAGLEEIVMNVKRYDAEGNTIWDYVGPVRVSSAAPESGTRKVVAEEVARQAERGVSKAERNAVKSQAEDIVNRVAKGESPLKEGGGFMRDSRLAQYQPEIIDTATKEMRNDLNELNKLSQGIRERAVKQEDVAKNIADNLPAQKAKAREVALSAQKLAGSIMADAKALALGMGKKAPQHFSGTSRELVSSLVQRANDIATMTDGAEIFNALDDLKRVVDNSKVALEQGSRRSAKDPMAYQNLIPRVEEFANQVRSSLEDAATFGRAGEMQKAYNATYHQKWFPAKRVFEESVFKVTGRDYRAFDTLDAWEGKITSLLKDAGTGERRHVGDMLGALKEMAEQRAKYGTASKAETGRIIELVEKINRTFELADETTAAARRMQNLTNAAGVAAGAAGAVFGGLPGAVISGGIARGAAELATGKYRRAFMSMRGATDDAVNKSVDDWIGISKTRSAANDTGKAARKRLLPTMTDEDKALLKSAKRLGTTFGVAQFLGDNDDAQSAFAQKKSALMDDEGFMNRFSEEFGDLAQEEPSVYMVAAGKAAEVRKFLVDRLPANIAVSMARPNGYPPTNEAVEDWSVYWNAATNPRSVISSMSRGDIRPQEVETLRTLYRPLYESLQASLIDRISRAQELGDELDDQFVMRMSMLFDLDGAGTPAFSNRAAAVARSVQPQQPAQQQKPFAPKAGSRVSPSNVAITGPTYGTMPG